MFEIVLKHRLFRNEIFSQGLRFTDYFQKFWVFSKTKLLLKTTLKMLLNM